MRCGQSREWEATPYFIKHPRIRKHDNPITSVILNIFNSRLGLSANSSKVNIYGLFHSLILKELKTNQTNERTETSSELKTDTKIT